jgi:polyisoprenoid-binding protein YceI
MAELQINGKDLSSIKGQISFDVASMKTGNDMRDDHLRSDVWLDAAKFPKITFTVKSVTAKEDGKVSVTGDFNLHGVAKELTTEADVKIVEKGGKTLIQVKTAFKVALADYNVKGKAGVVGNKVGKEIGVNVRLRGVIK